MQTTMTKSKVLNGVDVTALESTIAAIEANTEIAKFNFRVVNRWMGGDKNRSTIKGFTGALAEQREGVQAFIADNGEHPILLGHDEAPNPIEWLLHAMIGCMTTATAYHAAAAGITVGAIESEIEGDLDLRGFLGISPEARKGLNAVRVRMRVRTGADAPTIKDLATRSPVFDIVSRALPVSVAIETYH
ncbi:MAG: OsmC family peroxiredoxin [Alphaproteobacteria bacterium]|nr:OsmC family peroxiredoxin [Alphaproteobacteria bacterium]